MNRFFASSVALLSLGSGLLLSAALADSPASSYNRVEPEAVAKSPQNSWARSIIFDDEIVEFPAGRSQRLDRRTYVPMTLKSAGQAWIREDYVDLFQALPHDASFSFGGTVDQISRRYYLILDAAYRVETTPAMQEVWTDVLENPPSAQPDSFLADVVPPPDVPSAEIAEAETAEEVLPLPESEPDLAILPPPPAADDSVEAVASDDVDDSAIEDSWSNLLAGLSGNEALDTPVEENPQEALLPEEIAMVPEEPVVEDFGSEAIPSETVDMAADFPGIEFPEEEPAEEIAEEETFDVAMEEIPDDSASADDSLLVLPLGESAPPAIVPLVSLAPTKAELKARKAQQEEEERQARIRAEEEARARKEAEELARKEAEEAEKLAKIKAKEAERARKEAEELARKEAKEAEKLAKIKAKEEERARKEAEELARKEAKEAEKLAKIKAKEEERARKEAEELALKEAKERERMAREEAAEVAKRLREEEARALAAIQAREEAEKEAARRQAAREKVEAERAAIQAKIDEERARIEEQRRMAREVAEAEELAAAEALVRQQDELERQNAAAAECNRLAQELAALQESSSLEPIPEIPAEDALLAEAVIEPLDAALPDADDWTDFPDFEVASVDDAPAAALDIQEEVEEVPAPEKLSRAERRKAKKEKARERDRQARQEELALEVSEEPALEPAPAAQPEEDDIPDWMKPVLF